MIDNQPTATKFTRTQQSWAEHLLDKVRSDISNMEAALEMEGVPPENWDESEELLDLYDDEMFYVRYAQEMHDQREFIRKKYLE